MEDFLRNYFFEQLMGEIEDGGKIGNLILLIAEWLTMHYNDIPKYLLLLLCITTIILFILFLIARKYNNPF